MRVIGEDEGGRCIRVMKLVRLRLRQKLLWALILHHHVPSIFKHLVMRETPPSSVKTPTRHSQDAWSYGTYLPWAMADRGCAVQRTFPLIASLG